MFKMGSHDPFGHLKHKLWSKERPEVKLTVWFPTIKLEIWFPIIKLMVWLLTTKSQKSTQFPRIQVACDISLKSYRRGLQLCFRLHCNQRFAWEVMGPQSCGNPSCANLGTPTWESWDKMPFWMWPLWRDIKNTIREKVVASPKSGFWWVLWVQGCSWFILTPKMLKLCTNQCVVWFV